MIFYRWLTRLLRAVFRFFAPRISNRFFEVLRRSEGIKLRFILKDFIELLMSVGFFLVLNILAIFVFLSLPQGNDIIVKMLEDLLALSKGISFGKIDNLVFLLLGVTLWALASEFGTRYSLYVSDNSAKNLSQERVRLRKAMQLMISDLFLLLPFFIIILSIFLNVLRFDDVHWLRKLLLIAISIIPLHMVMTAIINIYLNDERLETVRQHAQAKSWLRKFVLTAKEKEWVRKLHGIYNDYVFSMPKPDNFAEPLRSDMQDSIQKHILHSPLENERFPASQGELRFPQTDAIISSWRVPQEFEFKEFQNEPIDEKGELRWLFEVPLKFYRSLHHQLLAVFITSVIILTLICFFQIRYYEIIGPPALVCLAFACFCGIYVGILFMDYGLLRKTKVSLRFVLVVLFLLTSFYNHDHPLRTGDNIGKSDTRPVLQDHFKMWLDAKANDTTYQFYTDTDGKPFLPVVFVCAEGGALRTGAFAGLMLSHLQQDPMINSRTNFANDIYAFSSVSGGSLGSGLFYAMNYLQPPQELKKDSLENLVHTFFQHDFLSPVLAKMFFGEMLQLFIPIHIKGFDRAIGLERAWERGYNSVTQQDAENIFSGDYLSYFPQQHVKPAFFINTTEIETGTQCWITNVRPQGLLDWEQRDLLNKKIRKAINYSTAINFSTRFPLVSPAAAIEPAYGKRYHYVDGGYIENTGASTMLEILQALETQIKDSSRFRIKPYVVTLRFKEEMNEERKNITHFNEISEILYGMINSRGGRTSTAVKQIKDYTEKILQGEYIELGLSGNTQEVPMNWVLSSKSINNISADINQKWMNRELGALNKFYFFKNYGRIKLADFNRPNSLPK